VRVLVLVTVVVWLAGELALRLPQRRRAERTVTREWRSLLVIWAGGWIGGFAAGILAKHASALDLPFHRTLWIAVGVAIAWCGIALRLWAIGTLGRYFKPIVHLQQDHHVVRSGPYKVLRHPAYTGLLLALFGISLTFANIASIAVFNCCIVAAILYRIRVEERTLLDGLGDEYAEYRRHTRRLIPGVW